MSCFLGHERGNAHGFYGSILILNRMPKFKTRDWLNFVSHLLMGLSCSHFYGWKITQEFEHKFLGVWLKYPWICLENQWILVQIFLVDPWVDPWINPWVHLGNSVPVRGRMQSVSVSLINYTFWLSFWAKVNFDWARKVPITDAKWQYSAQ